MSLGVTYTSYYLRRTFRQDGKVKHETLGNLSDLPLPVIDGCGRASAKDFHEIRAVFTQGVA